MGIHAHDRLLGGTKKDRVLARKAQLKHAKELEEEPPEPAAFTAAALGAAPGDGHSTASQPKKGMKKYAGVIVNPSTLHRRVTCEIVWFLWDLWWVLPVFIQTDICRDLYKVAIRSDIISYWEASTDAGADCALDFAGEPPSSPGADVSRVMSQLESLAVWKGVDVAVLARRLLAMTAEERTQLRKQYAAAQHGLMSQPSWSKLYSGSP